MPGALEMVWCTAALTQLQRAAQRTEIDMFNNGCNACKERAPGTSHMHMCVLAVSPSAD